MISISKTNKILSITIMVLFIFSSLSVAGGLANVTNPEVASKEKFDSQDYANGINDSYLSPNIDGKFTEDTNVGSILNDNEQTYSKIWDPWLTKGAIHAIATTEDGDMMALASGYLYDDQVHLYRWNYDTNQYDLVWEVGGGIFRSDVTSLAIADTDYNNLTEIIAGGEDGRIYVFEQRHLYDPVTNTENMFDLVWESPRLGRIFSLTVDDTDRDFRKDIIVGTGDTVRWFEYDTHGNYPFSKEHWIDFREVANYKLPSQVTAMAVSDLDGDGLKEVAVGMRSGEIQLLENAGESILINGKYFPIAQDNTYRSEWSNGNLIQRAITDMSAGNLDDDPELEILVAVQGQGAYVLDNYNGEVVHYRLQRPFQLWEANPKEIYPLDHYADAMVNSSSLFNGSYVASPNVFYRNGTFTSKFPEPLNYTGAYFDVYPYSSASVMKPDGKVSVFDATTSPAWAIFDMGQDEEGAANGIPGVWDVQAVFTSIGFGTQVSFAVSANGEDWYYIDDSNVTYNSYTKSYDIDVDFALANLSSLYYRYLMVNVTSGLMNLDYIYTPFINNPIYDALSTEVGPLLFKGERVPRNVGFIATIDGTILAVGWNSTTQMYEVFWDSWTEERYKLGTNVFDLTMVKHRSRFPSWMDLGGQSFTMDMSFLPDAGKMVSYTAENFYEYRYGSSMEFIVSSTNGNLFVYEQGGPYSPPVYNSELTNMMFSVSDSITVNQYIASQKSLGAKYFTASLIPVETRFASQYNNEGIGQGANRYVDPIINGYWLLIGSWDGYVSSYNTGGITDNVKVNDIAIFYLTQLPKSYPTAPAACDSYAFETCAYFSPLLNSTTGIQTLRKMEMTGAIESVFKQSSWMLKAAAGDFIGSKYSDIVTTNGGLHLLEVIYSQDPEKVTEENWVNPTAQFVHNAYGTTLDELAQLKANVAYKGVNLADAINVEFSDFQVVYHGDYFKTINEDAKGRKWTNANPVDFDGDGDMDLILGFARYEDTYFGFNKTKYGVTYWENQGTREEPIWVELSKGVNNNDPDSNFQHGRWTDPVLVWNNYAFPDGQDFDPILGYHPLYKTPEPSIMYMFQQSNPTDIFSGKLHGFFADYETGTSLLAATYPEAKRLEINLANYPVNEFFNVTNYGYHIFETWSNEAELSGWTLSMATADLDQDGKNEVIVGDFNNNAYVFEHLTNNTFKRAYKTFDLNRTIQTDKSPYANEQFAGISGTFNRTIFEHAELLIAGMDLNNNGQLEFIVSTGTMIFVFESVRTSVNRIRDDTYQLIKIFDLYDQPALRQVRQDKIRVTSMTWADDLTRNGQRELIVGVTGTLLIFEIYDSPYLYDYSMKGIDPFASPYFYAKEIFFGETGDLMGKFDLPGNHLLNPNYIISAMLVDDMDRDGKLDLVYAGTDTSSARPLWGGFVVDIEWDGSTFVLGLPRDSFDEMVKYNPINDIAVMDADYDDKFELVVGHKYGLDIYEYSAENTVELRDIITSNPHYRLPDRSYLTPSPSYGGGLYFGRAKDAIRLDNRPFYEGFGSNNNTLFMAYTLPVTNNKTYYRIVGFASSYDNGKTWKVWTSLTLSIDGGTGFLGVGRPSLEETPDGTIWLSISMRFRDLVSGLDYSKIRVYRLVPSSSVWVQVTTDSSLTFSLWKYGVYDPMGVTAAIVSAPGRSDYVSLFISNGMGGLTYVYSIYSTGSTKSQTAIPWSVNATNPSNFSVYDIDVEEISYGQYVLTFAGFPNAERKSLDTDIYVSYGFWNYTSQKVEFERPQRTFSSAVSSRFPSVIAERDTGNVIVAFEQPTLRPYGGLFAVWTNDKGLTWNGPYDMSHPLGLDLPFITAEKTGSGESYRASSIYGAFNIKGFKPMGPVLVPGIDRGFTMTYTAAFKVRLITENKVCYSAMVVGDGKSIRGALGGGCEFSDLSLIASAYNPWSNFTWYKVGEVSDIAVGDSDMDFRQEIFVASGKNAVLFEFLENTRSTIRYRQIWTSPTYERDISQVAISDGNGNGAPELIIESERGIVHSYEVVNRNPAPGPLLRPFNGVSAPVLGGQPMYFPMSVQNFDINLDGVDDIIVGTANGFIQAYDGETLDILWTHNVTTYYDAFMEPYLTLFKTADGFRLFSMVGDTLYMIDPYLGTTLDFQPMSSDIRDIEYGDVDGDGLNELILMTYYSIILYDPDDWVQVWETSVNSSLYSLEYSKDIELGYFLGNDTLDIALAGSRGSLLLFDSVSGLLKQNASLSVPYFDYANLEVADFDGDGLDDLFASSNYLSMVYSPASGVQLWNSTDYISFDSSSVIYDVNEDGFPDIIMGSALSRQYIFAIDGKSGSLLYIYRTSDSNLYWSRNPVLSTVMMGDEARDVVVFSRGYTIFSGYRDSVTYVIDAKTGGTITGIEGYFSFDQYITTLPGNTYPSLYVFNDNNTLARFDLSDGPVEPTPPTDNPLKLEPFIRLGEDFTSRTDYLLSDQFAEGAPGTDFWDDIFVVDDYFVGAADSYLLENVADYNDAVWAITDPDFGTYMGGAQIASLPALSSRDVLIVPFIKTLLIFDVASGELLDEWKYEGDFGTWNQFSYQVVDWDSDGVNDIVYSRVKYEGGVQTVEYGWFVSGKINAGPTWTRTAKYFTDPIFTIGDINLDGRPDMITYASLSLHPMGGNFTVFTDKYLTTVWAPTGFNPSDGFVILFPVTNMVMNSDGNRLYFTLDYSIYASPSLPVDLSVFPSIIFGFEWTGTTMGFATTSTVGLSPLPGGTTELYNVNNGTHDFLIGYGEDGDLYSMWISSSSILIPQMGFIDTLAVPYARNSISFGNFCGDYSFVMVTSATSVGCYDTYDLSPSPKPVWGVDLDFDIIQDIVKGRFGKDAFDDFIVTSKSGYVWIVNSQQVMPSLDLLGTEGSAAEAVVSTGEDMGSVVVSSLIYIALATAFVTNVVLLKRRRQF